MYQAGVPLRHMRICEPFGPEQLTRIMALSRYRTGSLGCYVRTSQRGKSGRIHAGHDNHFYGHRKILKPEHLDWQEYALLLLNSMPEKNS